MRGRVENRRSRALRRDEHIVPAPPCPISSATELQMNFLLGGHGFPPSWCFSEPSQDEWEPQGISGGSPLPLGKDTPGSRGTGGWDRWSQSLGDCHKDLRGLASILKPSKLWKEASDRLRMSVRRVNMVRGGAQKPGGGDAAGTLCSDQTFGTVLPGPGSPRRLRGKNGARILPHLQRPLPGGLPSTLADLPP